MTTPILAFIGAGNMTHGIVSGLIANGYSPNSIWVSNPSASKLNYYADNLGVHTTMNNDEAAQHAQVLILSVKPQKMAEVCFELKELVLTKKPLIISVAAGITSSLLQKWLPHYSRIVRAMPNIASLVMAGSTGLFAHPSVESHDKELAESIFRAVGIIVWLEEEKLLDAVTALSGCGPAYIFLVMEAMQEAAENLGLPNTIARILTAQTTLGAARLGMESTQDFKQLRQAVVSPQGTTERAINVLEKGEFRQMLIQAIKAAHQRAEELTKLLNDD